MDRRTLALLVAVAATLSTLGASADVPDIRSGAFAMTATNIKSSIGGFGEPSIALSSRDHVYVCGPLGIPGSNNGYFHSSDWTTFSGFKVTDRGGGGDCDIAVGPDDSIYTANLQAWGSAVRKSVDDGNSFDYQSSEDAFEQDRQWLAPDMKDGSIVYMGYHDWAINAIIVSKSLDGGKTWIQHSVASADPTIMLQSVRGQIPGPLRVDPTNHLRLYMVYSACSMVDDAVGCASLAGRTIVVARSEDGGLTWTDHVAMQAAKGSALGNTIPWLSVSRDGDVYVTAAGWTADPDGKTHNGLFMSASNDRGEHWNGLTNPIKVNAGPGDTEFPTVVAGANHVADFAWIESTATDPVHNSGTWTIHFAQSRNATDAAPTFTEVTGPPVHEGNVCNAGILCGTPADGGNNDRSLSDFIDMKLDSFGYAHIVAAANAGKTLHVLYWRQDAGPSATSEPCADAGAPTCVTIRPGPRP